MVNFLLFVFNIIIKFCNAFALHKAFGKQVSLTRIPLSGIFEIFSHTLTQLIAKEQDTDNSSDDENNSHGTHNGNTQKKKLKVTMKHQPRSYIQITESPIVRDDDNDIYVDTNYKQYNATIRLSKKGIQLKNTNHKSKPSVPTRKSSLEPLHQELYATIHDKGSIRDHPLPKIPPPLAPPPLITPPPYQTPSAPELFDKRPNYETTRKNETPKHLIPSVKLLEIQNPPPLDFKHLRVNKNINPLTVNMDMLDEEDRPHTNEVTFSDSQSITNYEI